MSPSLWLPNSHNCRLQSCGLRVGLLHITGPEVFFVYYNLLNHRKSSLLQVAQIFIKKTFETQHKILGQFVVTLHPNIQHPAKSAIFSDGNLYSSAGLLIRSWSKEPCSYNFVAPKKLSQRKTAKGSEYCDHNASFLPRMCMDQSPRNLTGQSPKHIFEGWNTFWSQSPPGTNSSRKEQTTTGNKRTRRKRKALQGRKSIKLCTCSKKHAAR